MEHLDWYACLKIKDIKMFEVIKYKKNNLNFHNLIKKKLDKYDVVIVKKFLDEKAKKSIFNFLKKTFYIRSDIRRSGEFQYLQKDYKRLDIGDSYINQRVSRFLLYTEWNKNNLSLYTNINKIIDLRNNVIRTSKDNFEYKFKGYNSEDYKFCDMVRMIQYPTGGGFLSSHIDREYLYPKQMVNVLVPFSKKTNKKKNYFPVFKEGGLFYIKNKKKIDIEKFLDIGDLIFHNQKIEHGVSSVDPDQKFKLDEFCGRITLNFSIGKFFVKN